MDMHGGCQDQKRALYEYYGLQLDDEERWYRGACAGQRLRRRLELLREVWKTLALHAPTVLDVGSGDGYAAERVIGSPASSAYIGIDLSASKLQKLLERLRCLQATAVLGDAERIPLADESIDCVLCLYTLEHLPNPELALMEIRRVLKAQGVCLLLVPVYSPLQARWDPVKLKLGLLHAEGFSEHLSTFTCRELVTLAQRCELAVVRKRYSGFRFPTFDRLGKLLPYRAFRAIDSWLSTLPIDRLDIGGWRFPLRLELGRGSLMVVLKRKG